MSGVSSLVAILIEPIKLHKSQTEPKSDLTEIFTIEKVKSENLYIDMLHYL